MNWRRFLRREEADAEQREELEFYVDATADDYIARGMEPERARAAARRKLGNATSIREEIYGMNTLTFASNAARDARHSLRLIRTRPGFSAAALLSLALGIGANTVIFSMLNTVLLRPLPYPAAERLVGVAASLTVQGQTYPDTQLSPLLYVSGRERTKVFEEFGVWTPGTAAITGNGEPEQVTTATVTQGVLPALGVAPVSGRWFSIEDDSPGTPAKAILNHGYWQRKFHGDPGILGRTIVIDSVPHEVTGILPRNFQLVTQSPDLLLAQRFPSSGHRGDIFAHNGVGRLRPGVTIEAANREIDRAWRATAEERGDSTAFDELHIRSNVRPLAQDVTGDVGPVLKALMGALGLVLLLVCANVANLVLVRARSRRPEFAVRAALGAGRAALARELLVESLVIGLLGGLLGVVLASIGLPVLVAYGPANLPRLREISLDGTAVLFALGCGAGCAVLFGTASLLESGVARRIENTRGATASGQQLRAQNALVMTQTALAFVLLVAAGLTLRSFFAIQGVAPGFTQPERVQTVRIALPERIAPEPKQLARMQMEILERISAAPGVVQAGYASGLPLEREYRVAMAVGVEGQVRPGQVPASRTVRNISPGLLAALNTRLIAGRDFTWADAAAQRRLVLVSENLARASWGSAAAAIGKRIRPGMNGPWIEVAGVVEDVYADGMNRPAPETVYFHAGVEAGQTGSPGSFRRNVTYAIRTDRASSAALVRDLAAAVHAVSPNVPLAEVRTLNDVYRRSTARNSFALVLLGIAAAMALTLAFIGVYGVLSYTVAQRRREVSIRLALGAAPRGLKMLFIRRGLIVGSAGAAIGLMAAAGLSRWIASLLFGVSALDPVTYGAAAAVIATAGAAASYLPARQAASLDPMAVLRSE